MRLLGTLARASLVALVAALVSGTPVASADGPDIGGLLSETVEGVQDQLTAAPTAARDQAPSSQPSAPVPLPEGVPDQSLQPIVVDVAAEVVEAGAEVLAVARPRSSDAGSERAEESRTPASEKALKRPLAIDSLLETVEPNQPDPGVTTEVSDIAEAGVLQVETVATLIESSSDAAVRSLDEAQPVAEIVEDRTGNLDENSALRVDIAAVDLAVEPMISAVVALDAALEEPLGLVASVPDLLSSVVSPALDPVVTLLNPTLTSVQQGVDFGLATVEALVENTAAVALDPVAVHLQRTSKTVVPQAHRATGSASVRPTPPAETGAGSIAPSREPDRPAVVLPPPVRSVTGATPSALSFGAPTDPALEAADEGRAVDSRPLPMQSGEHSFLRGLLPVSRSPAGRPETPLREGAYQIETHAQAPPSFAGPDQSERAGPPNPARARPIVSFVSADRGTLGALGTGLAALLPIVIGLLAILEFMARTDLTAAAPRSLVAAPFHPPRLSPSPA